ncbi:DUF6907 domain-containing protein [Streptomyces sp. NPDC096094]|uniref:DUF6907 domain-containing protein n=1 Tax=Streptomyces sp. NPDC096094 TaxID=3366073 RepID=UPI00381E1F2B
MTTPRTVTVTTVDHGDVTMTCPPWCSGHDDDGLPVHLADVAHIGRNQEIWFRGDRLWTTALVQYPYATDPERHAVRAYVEQDWHADAHEPAGLVELADTLAVHAERLRTLAARLTELRGGDQ